MSASTLVTTTTAGTRLGRNRAQIQRLVDTKLLPEVGKHGRTLLLDNDALQALAQRRQLADTRNKNGTDSPYALALHLGPRAAEDYPTQNERDYSGWDANEVNEDNQWTGWWNIGETIAREVTEARLPLLPAVSGFVVDVRIATGYDLHKPGMIRFHVADPSDDDRALFADTVFTPVPGSPWQRLWAPST
ncbi:hypothetical protein DMP15_29550 [Pseudonocardia sp. UM4_GMWB1]|uniref:hypothetical protein n=1 Tax=Pseudonocardia sp. UM4_GMWB1 TaxID=2212989 RepID=UPI00307E7416